MLTAHVKAQMRVQVSPCTPPYVAPRVASLDAVDLSNWRPAWRRVLEEVCVECGVSMGEMVGFRRDMRIAWPRQKAMFRLRRECGMTFAAIGRRLGGRDHSTVCVAVQAYERRLASGEFEARIATVAAAR